jgi:hypothetical protein
MPLRPLAAGLTGTACCSGSALAAGVAWRERAECLAERGRGGNGVVEERGVLDAAPAMATGNWAEGRCTCGARETYAGLSEVSGLSDFCRGHGSMLRFCVTFIWHGLALSGNRSKPANALMGPARMSLVVGSKTTELGHGQSRGDEQAAASTMGEVG